MTIPRYGYQVLLLTVAVTVVCRPPVAVAQYPDALLRTIGAADTARYHGDFAVADSAYRQVLAWYERSDMHRDSLYGLVLADLGAMYVHQERYEEAEPLLVEALQICEAELGARHEGFVATLETYSVLLEHTERDELAAEMRALIAQLAPTPAPVPEPPAAAPPEKPSGPALQRIYDEKTGVGILTAWPEMISCPRHDPQARPNRARAGDRYERERGGGFEAIPVHVEATLELVVGKDGAPDRKLTKVVETTDRRADRDILKWVQSCRFRPGRIGDEAVRVRIPFRVTWTFVR